MDLRHLLWSTKQFLMHHSHFEYYRWLLKNETRSARELEVLVSRRRTELLAYAKQSVPFYREALSFIDVDPTRPVADEDWLRIPILTRVDVIKNTDLLRAVDAREEWLGLSVTGGSTGTPVKVFHDKRFPVIALGWRMLRWWSISPSCNEANCWRSLPHLNPSHKASLAERLGLTKRRIFLDASNMNVQAMQEFINQMTRVKPALLQGYVGAIDALAGFVLARGLEAPSPQAVWLTASPSTLPQRQKIERAFGAPTYDQYGCSEVHYIAAECAERKGLHVFSDARYVEIVDDEGNPCLPGQAGNVLVTDLENRVFPLIRYANGDRASFLEERCRCGLPFPLMSGVRGRVSDNLKLKDSTVIAGEYLTTVFDSIPEAVSAFQVVQKRNGEIVFRVVSTSDIEHQVLEVINDFVQRVVKGRADVKVEFCEEIPHDRGKMRYVVREE